MRHMQIPKDDLSSLLWLSVLGHAKRIWARTWQQGAKHRCHGEAAEGERDVKSGRMNMQLSGVRSQIQIPHRDTERVVDVL